MANVLLQLDISTSRLTMEQVPPVCSRGVCRLDATTQSVHPAHPFRYSVAASNNRKFRQPLCRISQATKGTDPAQSAPFQRSLSAMKPHFAKYEDHTNA